MIWKLDSSIYYSGSLIWSACHEKTADRSCETEKKKCTYSIHVIESVASKLVKKATPL